MRYLKSLLFLLVPSFATYLTLVVQVMLTCLPNHPFGRDAEIAPVVLCMLSVLYTFFYTRYTWSKPYILPFGFLLSAGAGWLYSALHDTFFAVFTGLFVTFFYSLPFALGSGIAVFLARKRWAKK